MPSVKLVSVNIEGAKHLDLVEAFLREQMPDIVCMQELFEQDAARFAAVLGGAQSVFAPMMRNADPRGGVSVQGVGIFSRLPLKSTANSYYVGTPAIVDFDTSSIPARHETQYRCLLSADIEHDGALFRVATTHFTWTPDGSTDDFQREDMKKLMELLSSANEFVLCGDFNAPRIYQGKPGETFSMLAAAYKDNIPAQYETSLDPKFHRAPLSDQLDKMVDGLFSTPAYAVSDVLLHTGVSDHCAVTATIARA